MNNKVNKDMSTSKNKTPFDIENDRDRYAQDRNASEFLALYKPTNPKIINLNTKGLWKSQLSTQNIDSMTQDRIQKTYEHAKSIIKKSSERSELKIIDIGIGNAYVEKLLILNTKNIFLKITGLDIEGSTLEKLSKEIKGFIAVNQGAEEYLFKKQNEKFDLAFALEVLEHIDAYKIIKVIKSIKGILNKNGHLIISVPVNEDLEEKIKSNTNFSAHVRRYTPSIIKYELELAGFIVTRETKLFAFSKFYKLKSILSRLLKIKNPNVIILTCKKA